MKKTFTLLAMALMAMGASAQEQYAIGSDFTPTDGQEVQATASVKLSYGADGKWQNKAEGSLAGFTNMVVGGNNPKDGELSGGSSTGGGYTSAKQNLPKSGTYYVFTASAAGTIKAGIQLNGSKSFYIADSADGTCLSDKATLEDKDGNAKTFDGSGEYQVSDKLVGFVTFPVEAGKSYYMFCAGSKLSFYGFTFTASGGSQGGGEAEITLFDFSENNWGFPVYDSKALVFERQQFTNGTQTVTIEAPNEGASTKYRYYGYTDKNAIKISGIGAYLELPAFNFDVEAIWLGGVAGSSGSVIRQIFVNGEGVTDEIKGDMEDHVFRIPEANQAAGTIYQVKLVKQKPLGSSIQYLMVFPVGTYDAWAAETGIKGVTATKSAKAGIYNLSGQRVGADYKGIVIKDGKKTFVK